MNRLHVKRRMAVSIVAAILLLGLYALIFSFSAQDGHETGSVSMKVSRKCVDIADSVSKAEWSESFKKNLAEYINQPIRKLAHFSEYACMAILVYIMFRPWKPSGKALYLLTVFWVFLSASGDEFHQSFVSGRDGNFLDVLLDTSGGCFGLVLCIAAEAMIRKRFEKNCVNRECTK